MHPHETTAATRRGNQQKALRLALAATLLASVAFAVPHAEAAESKATSCPGDNGGLTLSPGFCATVFADNIGHARHMAVAADGTVYVNTWSGVYYGKDTPPAGGFLVALRDTQGAGKADVVQRFGDGVPQGSTGGTGIALFEGSLYVEQNDKILRYALPAGSLVPTGKPEVVVSDLPLSGDHPMHPFAIDANGNLFVDLGSASNACEQQLRMPHSPGHQPCVEKETRGGVWRYDARKTNQKFSARERHATGLRNAEGFAFDSAGRLFVTQHGRDQLPQSWGELYDQVKGAELPAEELVLLEAGADYGWPECYYDGFQKKLVLAPEYGGDGGRKVGVCAERRAPVAAFPAHWAPNAVMISNDPKLPKPYRDGAFIAFHGSWNRAPAVQDGYNVVYQPLKNGQANGDYVIFADGFAGASKEPGKARHRPSGVAAGPGGLIYIADDARGRIWQVRYQAAIDGAKLAAAPKPKIAAEATAQTALTPPLGATKDQLALGEKIFLGKASNGTCAGCHGSDAAGGPLAPNLTSGRYLWGDGSLAAIKRTIVEGVTKPKQYPGVMPPKGGAPLSDADVDALSAYVWALGHSKGK